MPLFLLHGAAGDVEQGLLGGITKIFGPGASEQASGFANRFISAIRAEDGGYPIHYIYVDAGTMIFFGR